MHHLLQLEGTEGKVPVRFGHGEHARFLFICRGEGRLHHFHQLLIARTQERDAGSPQSGVMAPTSTRSPGLNSLMLLPTSCTTPTTSYPSVKFSRGPMAPPTVWESEVQIKALALCMNGSASSGLFPRERTSTSSRQRSRVKTTGTECS
jgi:hypothetical protein